VKIKKYHDLARQLLYLYIGVSNVPRGTFWPQRAARQPRPVGEGEQHNKEDEMTATKQRTCRKLVRDQWQSRQKELERLIALNCSGDEDADSDTGTLSEYGLSFDYVAPGTFQDQKEGYWRYQLSWGGPSDEIRFFSSDGETLYRAEYWFLNWGDGAKLDVTENRCAFDLWAWFFDGGSVEATREEAIA